MVCGGRCCRFEVTAGHSLSGGPVASLGDVAANGGAGDLAPGIPRPVSHHNRDRSLRSRPPGDGTPAFSVIIPGK